VPTTAAELIGFPVAGFGGASAALGVFLPCYLFHCSVRRPVERRSCCPARAGHGIARRVPTLVARAHDRLDKDHPAGEVGNGAVRLAVALAATAMVAVPGVPRLAGREPAGT
jgi:hypothetical protein